MTLGPRGQIVAPDDKDVWDKLESVSGIVAGIAVAVIGGFATYLYNRRQQELEKVQRGQDRVITRVKTVGEFFPHLASEDERIKEAALVAVGALDPELAAKLSAILKEEGGIGALAKLANSPYPEIADEALGVLRDITDRLRESVVKVDAWTFDEIPDLPFTSTGFATGPPGRLVVPSSLFQKSDKGRITVQTFDRREMAAHLIHPPTEFAAILDGEEQIPALPLGATADLIRGDALQTLFYTPEFPEGALALCRYDGVEDGLLRIVGLTSGPGSSGAPLVDRSGRVVGMHVKRVASDVTMALSAEAIAEALGASATIPP